MISILITKIYGNFYSRTIRNRNKKMENPIR